jgi:hypothetical protein
MRRDLYIVAATLVPLILASANIRSPVLYSEPGGSVGSDVSRLPADPYTSQGEKITIFFHGLMIGRYKSSKGRFEVGIVKNAPDHTFNLHVREDDGHLEDLTRRVTGRIYEFDVVYDDELTSGNVVEPYRPQGKNFNRQDAAAAADDDLSKDYRYIPDIEGVGLHDESKRRRSRPFRPVFHTLKGLVVSKCLTEDPIKKKRRTEPDTPQSWVEYGYIAEVVGVDITLLPRQKLVLRNKDQGEVIWSCSYSRGKDVEARVLHLPNEKPRQDSRAKVDEYLNTACRKYPDMPPPPIEHFEYYYIHALRVDEDDRYDLRTTGRMRVALKRDRKERLKTIFPYKCGMTLQGKTGDDIDEDDIN